MYYRHDRNYTYPERSDQHMLELKRTREIHLDENYNYICTELKLMKDESVCNYRQICRT